MVAVHSGLAMIAPLPIHIHPPHAGPSSLVQLTAPSVTSTATCPATMLPSTYTHVRRFPLIARASDMNVLTVVRHPQNPCSSACSASHRAPAPAPAPPAPPPRTRCAAYTPPISNDPPMLTTNVPIGKTLANGRRVL